MDEYAPYAEEVVTPPAPFWKRFVDTFFSPGVMTESVAAHPKWLVPLVLGAVLIALQTALIPVEIFEATFRETMMQQGREMPEDFSMGGNMMRISGLVGGVIFWFVFTFIMAGVVTVVFTFLLGDEGRYKQHLAMLSHAWLIPAVIGLCLVPLRIAQENPQLNLSLGNFFYFLEPGYLKGVLTFLDLTQMWAYAVVAQGVHTIDPRRSFGSALAILLSMMFLMALVFGRFIPVQ